MAIRDRGIEPRDVRRCSGRERRQLQGQEHCLTCSSTPRSRIAMPFALPHLNFARTMQCCCAASPAPTRGFAQGWIRSSSRRDHGHRGNLKAPTVGGLEPAQPRSCCRRGVLGVVCVGCWNVCTTSLKTWRSIPRWSDHTCQPFCSSFHKQNPD